MRPIKFRVWCEFEIDGKLHKEMAGPENWFLLTQTGHLMSHGPISFDPNAEKKYKVLIPEFFTGLCDKNGKDLDWWEGDVFDEGGNIKQIVFEQGCFWLQWVKFPESKQPLFGTIEWAYEIKKIGTVHEEAKE